MDEFVRYVKMESAIYIAAFVAGKLVGVCYGHPSARVADAFMLQGVAVSLDEAKGYARRGIGSRLLASFEAMVRDRGFRKVDLGAADDEKVEQFYLKNGYEPYELVAKSASYETYERVPVKDYSSGKLQQEELRRKHDAHEVIFIFAKTV